MSTGIFYFDNPSCCYMNIISQQFPNTINIFVHLVFLLKIVIKWRKQVTKNR